jgi:hypothetical protein
MTEHVHVQSLHHDLGLRGSLRVRLRRWSVPYIAWQFRVVRLTQSAASKLSKDGRPLTSLDDDLEVRGLLGVRLQSRPNIVAWSTSYTFMAQKGTLPFVTL